MGAEINNEIKSQPHIWMVKTNSKEIIGPLTTRELLKHIELQKVLPGDEVALSGGLWIYVQNMPIDTASYYFHDPEQTPAASISGYFTHTPGRLNQERTPVPGYLMQGSSAIDTELTPTPKIFEENYQELIHSAKLSSAQQNLTAQLSLRGPLIATLLGAIGLASILYWGGAPSSFRQLASLGNSLSLIGTKKNPVKAMKRKELAKVERSVALGDYAKALEEIRELSYRTPNSKILWLPQAQLLIKNKVDLASAENLINRSLSAEPENISNALYWQGQLAIARQQPEKAAEKFAETLKHDPEHFYALINLAQWEFQSGRYQKALNIIIRAEKLSPENETIQTIKATILGKMGKLSEARVAFENAIQFAPERWSVRAKYTQLLLEMGMKESAQANWRGLFRVDPDYESQSPMPLEANDDHWNMGDYLRLHQKVMEAKLDEENRVELAYLGHLINPTSENPLAMEAPNGSLAARILNLNIVLRNSSGASELEQALSYLPPNIDAFGYFGYSLRGQAKMRLNHVAAAKRDLERAIELGPKIASTRYAYAKLLKSESNPIAALQEVWTVLKLHPSYIPANKLAISLQP